MKSKFHLINTEKNLGVRYGSFSFGDSKTFTNQRAKVSTDINYLADIRKFDQSNLTYPGNILVAYKKLDVEKFVDKDSDYYAGKLKELRVYSNKCKEDYNILKPVLGIYKKLKVFDKKEGRFKFKKKFFAISKFLDLISKKQTYITRLLVDLALDSNYHALINPYKLSSFKHANFVNDIEDSIKRRNELLSQGFRRIDIIPNIPLNAKHNREFEEATKYVYLGNQEFSSLDFSYASRINNIYNYNSMIELNKDNENVMNILSDIHHRRMPDKSFNLSPYHYYPIYRFDVIAKGMPLNFLAVNQEDVHDKPIEKLRFFEDKSLSLIKPVRRLILSPDFTTAFPLLSNNDFEIRQEILKKASKARMLDTVSKVMEFYDSHSELSQSQHYVADNSYLDYIKEKNQLREAFARHNHLQKTLTGF